MRKIFEDFLQVKPCELIAKSRVVHQLPFLTRVPHSRCSSSQDNGMFITPEHIEVIVNHTFASFGFGEDNAGAGITLDMFRSLMQTHPQLIASMTIATWQLQL